jgi:hypothetical protein
VYYTRTELKAHYEKRHQHFEGTAYQGFGTGYNIRMYEATLIYMLASAYNCKSLADQRNVSPFKSGRCTHYEVYLLLRASERASSEEWDHPPSTHSEGASSCQRRACDRRAGRR